MELWEVETRPPPTVEVPLLCPRCRQKGTVIMEGRTPVDTSRGFYLRVNYPGASSYQIVCLACGRVHGYPDSPKVTEHRPIGP